MVENIKPSAKAKKRNVGLSVWLVLMLIVAAWSALANLGLLFSSSYSFMPGWVTFIMGLLGVVNFILLIYVWQWKLWAFQGLVGTAVLAFILNLIGGVSFWNSLFGFLGVVVLYLFMRAQWKWFE